MPDAFRRDYASSMATSGKPKRNWIQEERRKTLGDWVAFCIGCGFTLRYFVELEGEIPATCPNCDNEVRHLCPSCGARFPSAFLVECEECGAEVRPNQLFGGPIRKAGK
jgi:hypothetical protein